MGKKIKLLEFDNYSEPIQSKLAAKKAVRAKVTAVIGASWSSHSIAMAPVLEKAKIPMISPDSTNPKVTRLGKYIFRACFIDPFQGEVLAKFVRQEFHTESTVMVTDIASAYSMGLSEAFRKSFERLGGEILAELEYKKDLGDFSELLTRAKELNPDVLFVSGHDESGFIVKQAQDHRINSTMIGGDGWGFRQFLSNGGQELKLGSYTTHWSKDVDTPKSREFVERYRKKYEINDFAANVYDAVMLLADAIRRAGSLDRTKIRDALAKTRDFQGISGNITFDEHGDPVKSAVIMKITDGTPRYYKIVNP